jgi:protein O-GlcNAc transferase
MANSPPQDIVKKAMQLHYNGEFQKAKELYLQVLAIVPAHPDALHLYGLACHQQGDHETAVRYIRKAIEQVPGQPVLHNNLGDALHKTNARKEAIEQFKIALKLRPDYAGAHQNLSSVYSATAEHDAALAHARKAVHLNDKQPEAWFNLGLAFLDHVLLAEAADAFRRALALRPNYFAAVTSLLYILNHLPDTNPDEIADETHKVATAAFESVPQNEIRRDCSNPVRIGYVSADFCAHAVNYFFEPVLEHHDKKKFELYLYSDVRHPDNVTQRLKQLATHWRDTRDCTDTDLSTLVQQDNIDILVDLAGYTRSNRMAVFADRAAAVQISWLGFPNTTGLEAMDYRIVDTCTAPTCEANAGTETLMRLPNGFACFRPPAHAPGVQPLPAIRNGHVTLGCLHKLEKINPRVVELWAGILLRNPNTRLMLARDQLDDWQQRRLRTLFEQHGIAADRLEMIEFSDPEQSFFSLFADMDILLDTFPWSGHTLACCALWMGVPVVSLYGNSHAGRMVASVLKLMGLDELVAADAEAYSNIITGLCNDQDRLDRYRRQLRERFMQSSLRDEESFTREMEAQFLLVLNAC